MRQRIRNVDLGPLDRRNQLRLADQVKAFFCETGTVGIQLYLGILSGMVRTSSSISTPRLDLYGMRSIVKEVSHISGIS